MSYNSYYESAQDQDFSNLISDIGATKFYPSHFHKKIEITYVKTGHSLSVINSQKITAEKDDLIFVPEYYPHSYATSDDTERYVLLPTEEYERDLHVLLHGKTFPYLLSDKEFNRREIYPILQQMYAVRKNASLSTETRTLLHKGYALTFYGKLYERYGSELVPRAEKINHLTSLLLYLDEHFTENITLDSLAQVFNYNKFYLSKLFNSCVNDNLKNYVNSLRVKKFIQLYMANPSANITETALSLGFESTPTFYRAFKRIYGSSPKEYFAVALAERK